MRYKLKNITRKKLEPLWSNHRITTQRIADALSVSRGALSHHAKKLGLPSRRGKYRAKGDDQAFREMWLAGVSTTEMARHFGYAGHSTVCHRAGVLCLPRRVHGGRGGFYWDDGVLRKHVTLADLAQEKMACAWKARREAEIVRAVKAGRVERK